MLTAITPLASTLTVDATWVVQFQRSSEGLGGGMGVLMYPPGAAPVGIIPVEAGDLYTVEVVVDRIGDYTLLVHNFPSGAPTETLTFTASTVAAVPDLAAIKTYLGSKAQGVADASIEDALDAERQAQATACRVSPYNAALAEALKRRVARNLAMRSVTLGVQVNDGYGLRIGSTDPEVRRLEGPYRRVVMG